MEIEETVWSNAEEEDKTDVLIKIKRKLRNQKDQKKNKRKQKLGLQNMDGGRNEENYVSDYKRENDFSLFNKYVEAEIHKKLDDEAVLKSTTMKKKCRSCGYKRKCHLEIFCKTKDKTCFACLKTGHFPKSPNCKAKKKTSWAE